MSALADAQLCILSRAFCPNNLKKEEYMISNGECRKLREYLEELASICGKEVAIGERSDDGVRYDEFWFSDNELHMEQGQKVIVWDRREHIGGNMYDFHPCINFGDALVKSP